MAENTNKWIIWLRDNWKSILLILSLFIIIALIMSTTCTKQKLDIADNNIKALQDTLHTYVLKNGELMYEKQGYILEKKDLERYIGVKESEVKELEKKLGSALATISKLQGQVKVDTIRMKDSIYITDDSIYVNDFKYEDKWISLNGKSTFELNPFSTSTIINQINMAVPLKVGTTEDNKWFAVSDNPYVSFTSVEGANMEKTKSKRWSFGIQGGVGVVGGVGLVGTQFKNISTSNTGAGWFVGAGFYIGVGLSYKLTEF